MKSFFVYLIAMALVTYLVRAVPILFMRKKIENIYIISFLRYMPYAVLSVMTIPACFYVTENPVSGVAGLILAIVLALKGGSLLTVAAGAAGTVLVAEMIQKII